MFQKLYKHLEGMNDSLRQQESNNTRYEAAAQKISEQLDQVNDTLLSQTQLLASRDLPSKDTSQSRRGIGPVLQLINLVLCSIGIVAITYFSVYTVRLSRITEKVMNNTASIPPSPPATHPSPGQQAAYSGGSSIGAERHLAKLDSLISEQAQLISEQAQSIKELKKLNSIAVRTFNHIKRHLDVSDSVSATFTRR
jgi:hypothetical protein